MADDRDDSQRTEEPTQRRLDDAHDKGDVVKSQELATFAVIAGGTLALAIFAGSAASSFTQDYRGFLANAALTGVEGRSVMELLRTVVLGFVALVGPPIALMMVVSVAGHIVQHRPVFTAARLKPDFSKISPMSGFKRLFGLEGLVNFGKGLFKLGAVGFAAFLAAWPERGRIQEVMAMDPAGAASLALAIILKVLMAGLAVLAVIAAADYLFQRQRFMARHRMTRQELKDEHKQSEGDPQIKARIRQIRYERAKKRMIAAVPDATVVITNPTHYAVALQYESGKMSAPVCVAKGADHLALTIRKVAEEHGVPIVENPPLARALFAAVEVDETIPPEHFRAVAQVIGYVLKLAKQNSFWRN